MERMSAGVAAGTVEGGQDCLNATDGRLLSAHVRKLLRKDFLALVVLRRGILLEIQGNCVKRS